MNVVLSIITIIGLASFMGCDVPTQTRYSTKGAKSTSPSIYSTYDNSSDTATSTGTTSTSSDYDVDVPVNASHCSWALDGVSGFMSLSTHLSPQENNPTEGAYSLCQSRENQQVIYFQLKNAIDDAQVCFIPTYQIGTSTTYIGEPRCIFAINPKKVYQIDLYRNRPGFSHLPVTGVMVMKDKAYSYPAPFNQYFQPMLSTDAFIICNQQLVNPNGPNANYCAAFKQAGHYIYQQF